MTQEIVETPVENVNDAVAKELMAKYANTKEVKLLDLNDDEIDELEQLEYCSSDDDYFDED